MTASKQQDLIGKALALGLSAVGTADGWLQVGLLNKTKDASKVERYLKDERRKRQAKGA